MELTLIQRAEDAERATAADEFRIISEAALAIFGWQDERYKRVLRLLEAGASLDAAMQLVPEGWTRTVKWSVENEGYALVYDPSAPDDSSIYALGKTAALALCAAALRARAAS